MMVPARPREVTVPSFEKTCFSWKGYRASGGPYIIAQVKQNTNYSTVSMYSFTCSNIIRKSGTYVQGVTERGCQCTTGKSESDRFRSPDLSRCQLWPDCLPPTDDEAYKEVIEEDIQGRNDEQRVSRDTHQPLSLEVSSIISFDQRSSNDTQTMRGGRTS